MTWLIIFYLPRDQHALNQFLPNSIASKYMEQNFAKFFGGIGKSKAIPGDFNTSFSVSNRIKKNTKYINLIT